MKAFALTLLLCTAVYSLHASVDNLSSERILEKHIKAVGNRANMEAIRTIKASGNSSDGTNERKLTLVRKRPDKVRLVLTDDNQRMTIAYDGIHVWYTLDLNGKRVKSGYDEEAFKTILRDSFFWPPLASYEDSKYKISQKEDASIKERPQYVFEVTIDGFDDPEVYYLDKDTLMITRRVVTIPGSENIVTEFGDYKNVSGVQMPFFMSTYTSESVKNDIELDRIDVNKGVFDSYFEFRE